MKTLNEFVNEINDDGAVIYEVKCRDREGSLKKMLEHIANNGNGGHSFSIIVDADGDSEQRKSFGWDGDGGDYIYSIKEKKA